MPIFYSMANKSLRCSVNLFANSAAFGHLLVQKCPRVWPALTKKHYLYALNSNNII